MNKVEVIKELTKEMREIEEEIRQFKNKAIKEAQKGEFESLIEYNNLLLNAKEEMEKWDIS